jgi:hypothetical protein
MKEFNQQLFGDTFNRHRSLLSESVGIQMNEAMEWKDIPEEDRTQAMNLIGEHNKSVTKEDKKGYYAIDVTGKHQVYYTFWRVKQIDPRFAGFIKNPIYMGNLTTNLLSAVTKALAFPAVKNVELQLWTDATAHGLIGKTKNTPTFTFGKYRGKTFAEVYLDNPGYFAWLAQNQDPKYAGTEASTNIRYFADLYFQDMTKKNLETSASQFIGQVGEKYNGELEIYNISVKNSPQGSYTVYKLKDGNDNKFLTFNLGGNFPNAKVGDKINIKAKIKAHKEIVGIKFTALNYVKPI